ncbi:MAG: ABC transporter permease [Candidatus Symbiobacter sp.]|nr:ABC transporter permease [Candidatus Symbiobacter sp.]
MPNQVPAARPPQKANFLRWVAKNSAARLANLGQVFLRFLAQLGVFALFFGRGIYHIFRPPFYLRLCLRQLVEIGFYSLPVVGLTALFTGMVLALQSYTGFSRFNAESAIANVVALSMVRELGPVLAGLMVAGRVGAAMAAELGTMRVTEQIDAMQTLSTHPIKYLVVPRLVAGMIALPILVLIADVIGIMGGWVVAVGKLDFNSSAYMVSTVDFIHSDDVVSGLVKAAVFGLLIALSGCYFGYHSKRGAQGVGQATTLAVVMASILILASDYVLTELFFARH